MVVVIVIVAGRCTLVKCEIQSYSQDVDTDDNLASGYHSPSIHRRHSSVTATASSSSSSSRTMHRVRKNGLQYSSR